MPRHSSFLQNAALGVGRGRTYHSAGFALLRVRLPEGFAKVGAFAAMYIGHHMARCLPSFPCLRKVAVKEVAQQCVVLVERHWLV